MSKLLLGDCLNSMKQLPDNSVDSIVTDPPYGLSFMGKKWDYDVPSIEIWKEALRVLKPGGHLLSFGGTRTYHRLVVNIEDAGFEIRDCIQWLYGSGFPKSTDVSKRIDKEAGVEFKAKPASGVGFMNNKDDGYNTTLNQLERVGQQTDSAKQWQGWGTALKPANEPICVARKPLEKGLTVAENVLKYGTGGINIDASRIGFQSEADKESVKPQGNMIGVKIYNAGNSMNHAKTVNTGFEQHSQGRWPANIILDEEAAVALDEQSGTTKSSSAKRNNKPSEDLAMSGANLGHISSGHDDSGGASRFFYVAKASKSERNKGLEGMPLVESGIKNDSGRGFSESDPHKKILNQNFHPTVKPIKLMEYLIKLVTPPNGTVLDPFMGSGSTGVAAKKLGIKFIGCEMSEDYFKIAKKRIENE